MCSPLCINKNFLAKSSLFPLFSILFFLPLNASSDAPLSLSFFLDSDSLSQCFYIFYSEFYCYYFYKFSSVFYFWVKKDCSFCHNLFSLSFQCIIFYIKLYVFFFYIKVIFNYKNYLS